MFFWIFICIIIIFYIIIIIENKGIKKVIKREELIDNIGIFNECEVKMPDTIKILLKLKEKGIDIHKIKDYRKKD